MYIYKYIYKDLKPFNYVQSQLVFDPSLRYLACLATQMSFDTTKQFVDDHIYIYIEREKERERESEWAILETL